MKELLFAIILAAPLAVTAASVAEKSDPDMHAADDAMDHDRSGGGCRMCAARGRMAGMDKGGDMDMGAMPMRGPEMMMPGMMGPMAVMSAPDAMARQHRLAMLDLTPAQRAQVDKIQNETRSRNWDALGKVMDAQAKLRELYAADTLDAKAIGAAYASLAKSQQQIIEAQAEAINRMHAVLTPEQREQLKKQPQRGMMQGSMGKHSGMDMRPIDPIK